MVPTKSVEDYQDEFKRVHAENTPAESEEG